MLGISCRRKASLHKFTMKKAASYFIPYAHIPWRQDSTYVHAFQMCAIHEIHIRNHDFGEMQKNASKV